MCFIIIHYVIILYLILSYVIILYYLILCYIIVYYIIYIIHLYIITISSIRVVLKKNIRWESIVEWLSCEDAVMCPVDRIQQYFGSEVAPWIPLWDHGQLQVEVKYLKDIWALEQFNFLDEALFTVFLIDLY